MWSLLTTFSWQELRRHPGRAAAALVSIMLGVALGLAVHVINQSALDEFGRAVRSVGGQPDLQVQAMQGGLPHAVYALIARQPQVARAAPWIEATVQARLAQTSAETPADANPEAAPTTTLQVLGGDALQFGPLAPQLLPRLFADQDRLQQFAPDAVFLNAAALQALGLAAEQASNTTLLWQAHARSHRLRVVGTVAAAGPPLALMDIGAAQDLLGPSDAVHRVDLLLAEGAHRQDLVAALRANPDWPAQALVQQPGDTLQRVGEMSRAYRVNLTVLALVALFTGAFLVFSVLALSVAQRAPQFALLAVLGLTPHQRLGLVLAESAVLGVLGSAAGIALGLGLAALALRLLGGDLGGGYFTGVQPALRASPGAAAVFGGLGLLATLVGGWWPARAAQQLAPAATLKGLGLLQAGQPRAWPGLALMAAAGALACVPPIAGIPLAAYGAVGLLLLGGMALLPWLLGQLLRLLPSQRLHHPLALLAVERARRMRASATVAVGGVVASLSLAVALTVMVTSFRTSMMEWLDAVLPSPLYVRAAGGTPRSDTALLPPPLLAQVAALPGVQRAQPLRTSSLQLDAQRPAVALLLRPLHGEQAQQLPWLGERHTAPPGRIPVYVSEAVAQLYGVQPGQDWPLLSQAFRPLAQSGQAPVAHFFVAGLWRDYVRQFGAVAMDWNDWLRLTGDTRPSELALWPAPGADEAALQQAITALLPTPQDLGSAALPALEFTSSSALRARSLRIFDRSFAVTYWLQAVAIAIGLFGIAASFSAQVLARRKEFGLLAHLGLTRRQVLAVVAGEGAAWTGLGAIAGSLLGLGVAAILVYVVNPQSFHWSMELHLPLARLLALASAVVAAGTLTAWLAGRAAAGRQAVLAVKEDW